MRLGTLFLVAVLLLVVPIAESARNSSFKCYLMSTWWNFKKNVYGSNYIEGQFNVTLGTLPNEHSILRTFRVADDRVATTEIGVEYLNNKLVNLVLSLHVTNANSDPKSPDYVANEVSARCSFDARWHEMSVKKSILIGDEVRTYEFVCARE